MFQTFSRNLQKLTDNESVVQKDLVVIRKLVVIKIMVGIIY